MKTDPIAYDASAWALKSLYHSYAANETQIPIFVEADLYETYRAVDGSKYLKTMDRSGKVLAVRPDATFHALCSTADEDSDKISRIYYITELIRYERTEMQEILQTGAEFFNDPSSLCDAELVSLAMESLTTLGIHGFRVDIGNCQFISSLLDEDKSLDSQDRIQIQKFISHKDSLALIEYMDSKASNKQIAKCLSEVCLLFGDYSEVLEKAKKLCVNEGMSLALNNLDQVATLIAQRGHKEQIYLDLGFSNWMDYYSAMIFKIYVQNVSPEVISGGRYDTLASRLGHRKFACGFGHRLDLTLPLAKLPQLPKKPVFIGSEEKDFQKAYSIASMLRAKGYSVEAAKTEKFIADIGSEKFYNLESLIERLDKL